MQDNALFNFIVVDDSPFDIRIAEKIIERTGRQQSIRTFDEAQMALEHIGATGRQEQLTVILLDVRMPVMDGFDFMQDFEQFPDALKSGFRVFFLSSSMNQSDISRATSYPSVVSFLNKPISPAKLGEILDRLV